MAESSRPPSWEVVKRSAEAVANISEKYKIPILIMKIVPQIMKGMKADRLLLKESVLHPDGEMIGVVKNAKLILEGGDIDLYAKAVAVGLNALAIQQPSFIVPSAKK